MGRNKNKNKKKRMSRSRSKVRVAKVEEDEQTTTTEDTESELTEVTPLVEKMSRNQRKAERKQSSPRNVWSDLNLMCGGCCGAMEVIEPAEVEEDLFADDENILSKFGHSIMHKAGFAPPVKVIRCTEVDDDSVITTPKVLVELAKQYDKERFWSAGSEHNDDEGTVATSRTNRSSMTSISKKLIPSLSISGKSRASKSVISLGTRKNKRSKEQKKPMRLSEGRFEI